MTKNQIWWLGLGGVVVAGAVAYYVVTKAGNCSGDECQITVKVIDCPSGKIDVIPDRARITAPKHIKWTIKESSHVFSANGIQITGSDFTPDHQGGQGPGKDKWRIRDSHATTPGEFKYIVNVQTASGTACGPKDPFIVNE